MLLGWGIPPIPLGANWDVCHQFWGQAVNCCASPELGWGKGHLPLCPPRESIHQVGKERLPSCSLALPSWVLHPASHLSSWGHNLGMFGGFSPPKVVKIHPHPPRCGRVPNSGLQLKVCSGFPFPCSSFYSTFPSYFTFLGFFSLFLSTKKKPNQTHKPSIMFSLPPSITLPCPTQEATLGM